MNFERFTEIPCNLNYFDFVVDRIGFGSFLLGFHFEIEKLKGFRHLFLTCRDYWGGFPYVGTIGLGFLGCVLEGGFWVNFVGLGPIDR